VLNTVQVSADGGIGEVATPQLLKHELTQLVHRESSFSASQATPAVSNVGVRTRACVRRRRGFVQVGLWEATDDISQGKQFATRS
jgi:hypothetical protein